MLENFKSVLKTSPFKIIGLLIIGWIVMVGLNYFLNENHFFTGSRITFPISVVYFSTITFQGVLFSIFFLLTGLFALKNYYHLNLIKLFIAYILLIIFGNLAQGSIHQTFLRSFLDTDFQYFHDVVKIKNGYTFISSYNEIQDTLTMHAKTHPPFAVWIQYIIYKIFNESVLGLAIGMSILSLCSFFPLVKIIDFFKIENSKRNILLLIFALIPAVNIYSIVSIDAVFLFFSLIFLYGMLIISRSNSINIKGILLAFIGFSLANSISFSGTFFACVAAILSIYQLIIEKNKYTIINFIIVGILFLFYILLLQLILDYNHIEAFFNASKLENPNGFRGFHQPIVYLFTRLENISEILLFLSFGFFAYLFTPKVFNLKKNEINFYLPIIAFLSLMLMFLTGAYGTGETARACLYLYPYILLLLINVKEVNVLKNIAYIALLQTFVMQLIGDYFW